jgi:hypothetical protein
MLSSEVTRNVPNAGGVTVYNPDGTEKDLDDDEEELSPVAADANDRDPQVKP